MQRQALLNQTRLDARGGVIRRILGVTAKQRCNKVHERAFDMTSFAVALQAALDQVVKYQAIACPFQAIEMATDAQQ